jgi:hypothetical protein
MTDNDLICHLNFVAPIVAAMTAATATARVAARVVFFMTRHNKIETTLQDE